MIAILGGMRASGDGIAGRKDWAYFIRLARPEDLRGFFLSAVGPGPG